MVRIVGVIDNFKGSRSFGGWARASGEDGDQQVTITAFYGEDVVGEAVADQARSDLGRACGFAVETTRSIDVVDVKTNRFRIQARAKDGSVETLNFYGKTLESFEFLSIGRAAGEASDHSLRLVLKGIMESKRPIADVVRKAIERFESEGPSDFIENTESSELSMFGFRVGLKSPDGSSVIGMDGHMFITAGTNRLLDLYRQREDDASVQSAAQRWGNIFRERRTRLEALETKYLQVVIPDKSSVIPEFFPIAIEPPTGLLSALQRKVAMVPDLTKIYLNTLELFINDEHRTDVFRKVDSHLSAYGAQTLMRRALETLGLPVFPFMPLTRRSIVKTDLGSKFTSSPLYEEVALPDFVPQVKGHLRQLEFRLPKTGRNIGMQIVWANTDPILPYTVVVFGNSFFERGDVATSLSWWGARIFKNFHFLWRPDVDYEYIKNVRPDFVICQTNERFMPKLPAM
jgi:hypothetical protein